MAVWHGGAAVYYENEMNADKKMSYFWKGAKSHRPPFLSWSLEQQKKTFSFVFRDTPNNLRKL